MVKEEVSSKDDANDDVILKILREKYVTNDGHNNIYDKNTIISKMSAPRLTVELFSGSIVGAIIGYMLDRYFDTLPWMLIICVIFGFIGGMYNAYRSLIKSFKRVK